MDESDFIRNLRDTMTNLRFYASHGPQGKQTTTNANKLVDYFQYAGDASPKDIMRYHEESERVPNRDLQYTPFAWVDNKTGDEVTGLVVSGQSPNGEGTRILGAELDNGTSLSANGAKQFFEGRKKYGVFRFADQYQLGKNKRHGDWPLQPGNPFIFIGNEKGIDDSGYRTFKAGKSSGYQNLSDAMDFINKYRYYGR